MLGFIKDNLFLWIIIFLLIVAPSFLFGAVQLLAYIIFGFFLIIIVGMLIFKWRIAKVQKTMYERYGESYRSTQEQDAEPKVYRSPNAQEKKISDNVGDYVDFEEVDK